MTADEDDLDQLLAAASAAAHRPKPAPAPSDPVAELLATAEDLAHADDTGVPPADDVAAFLAQAKRPRAAAGRPAVQPVASGRRRPTGLYVVLGIVAAVVIAVVAYAMGQGSSGPTAGSSPAASSAPSAAPVDQAQVAALTAKIAADPKDSASLQMLGNIYYDANDYAKALTFYEKIAALAPQKDGPWIAVAAAAYQSGQEDRAVEAWQKALAINPDNIEAHYGLGFYYLDKTPADEAKAKEEWAKVVAIDPTSDLAKQVTSELARLASAGTTPAPSASAGG